METSVNNGMCRCCASEGAFKDVKSTYHWMGEEEIYSDMLRDCFDINLEVSEQGQDGGICEVCITQLRNAINFKKQVLHTEEQFKIHLQNKTMFRPNIVKVELQAGEDSDDLGSGDDAFSGPEFEVPIKMETEETKPKKRGAKASATTTRAKKAKADNGETSNKRVPRNVDAPIRLGNPKNVTRTRRRIAEPKDIKINEITKHRSNIHLILQCTNATPIRCRGGIGYACSFCGDEYPDPADLKKHTLEVHDDKAKLKFMAGKMMFSYLVKLDITDLTCKICSGKFETLELISDHLMKTHDKKMFTDIKNHVMTFKFGDDALKCMFCQNVYYKFKNLQQHMNVHYRNFVCEFCDAGFINKNVLTCHVEGHKTGTFKCDLCPKVFDTHRKKKSHEKSVHIHANLLNKCGYCQMKFTNYKKKDEHLVKVHGVTMKTIRCHACDKTFDNKGALSTHTKRDHLMERKYKCTECDMGFYLPNALKLHMVKHTGERTFKCTVCSKSYGRHKTLREHMRIHNDDRRFKCEHCGQAFVQKCSWKGHMRSRHGELV
nr:zinc finger protein 723 isoform X7 [Helicoverpa armigera]